MSTRKAHSEITCLPGRLPVRQQPILLSIYRLMQLELSDAEREALARFLRSAIERDRYPPSPRFAPLKAILATLDPQPQTQQTRTDFAAIESNLEFIMSQLAQVPTRKQLARYSLLVMVGTACLVQTLAFLLR
jgi:hypothetical protein